MPEPDGADIPDLDDRVTVRVHLDPADWSTHLAEETARGLRDRPPWIPPVWFYDEAGSKLFDHITRLPEYYPTEAERSILRDRAGDIARLTSSPTLIELGSGTSDKTMLLLDALESVGTLRTVAPFDVSEEVLRSASRTIAATYPDVTVDAVVGDFHRHLGHVPTGDGAVLAFLGSTIGNLDPDQRGGFLAAAAATLADDDWFLLGTDLVKPVDRLLAAYDDAAGVTAEFNLNALSVVNRELGADFDRTRFRHRAHWDDDGERIEMHLVADGDQTVTLSALDDLVVDLRDGDHIRTEISTKFTPEGVAAELADAGLEVVERWTDADGDFLLTLARRA
ncbi:L-histidine N(alpha)-methyltransferase [Dermatobacter hominis]|uniref:L-histidine N(alpha)-methyltransferase n=1 Tax=Dermatobacter hominis TaxID=2884263 RepID=UPI001D10C93C|nr:L-histidine N(alpha)-methyltransferase [Dermatobacter hominis]UDY37368.1 L-histidine N(alpha)-methyltransferase [Dermatobacter hominis]